MARDGRLSLSSRFFAPRISAVLSRALRSHPGVRKRGSASRVNRCCLATPKRGPAFPDSVLSSGKAVVELGQASLSLDPRPQAVDLSAKSPMGMCGGLGGRLRVEMNKLGDGYTLSLPTSSPNNYNAEGRSVEATLAGEEKPSTCASPFLKLAADEEQLGDVHGTNIRQAGECLHVHSEPARLDCREPFSVVRGLSEAWRTVPTMATHEPPSHVRTMACPISDDRENVCGTDDAAISGGREPCPDLFAEGAGVSLRPLDPRRTSSNETEDGGVVAEDWLDAVHAIDSSESDSAVG